MNTNIKELPKKGTNRKYTLNEYYFSKIDSEDKAYFLGLLYADGTVTKDNYTINLQLQEDDKNILYKFNEFIQSNRPIRFIQKRAEGRKNTYICKFSSKILWSSVINLGCTCAKSLTLEFPDQGAVSIDFVKHFIRGYFDGDGCISLFKDTRANRRLRSKVVFASSLKFCKKLQEVISELSGVNFNVYVNKNNHMSGNIEIGGNIKSEAFLNWMYKDATIYLDRKYEKFLQLKKINCNEFNK